MKVDLVSYSDSFGGAARAAYRIHSAIRGAGVNSRLMVMSGGNKKNDIVCPDGFLQKLNERINYRGHLGQLLTSLLKTGNPILHSPAIIPSNWSARINASKADLVHLHWVNHEMMSISDIGRIKKPIVWTLHDMWAFCGAEHVSYDTRWKSGYSRHNRPNGESGFDLNRWVWSRKMVAWKSPITVVTPSRWLSNLARNSILMRGWNINVIPNPIETNFWKPINKKIAREILGITKQEPVVLFGGSGGAQEFHKGFDLLEESLSILSERNSELQLLILGMERPNNIKEDGFFRTYTGHIHDDLALLLIYSAADMVVIPSRIDNLPNIGIEAMSCGVPVVGFNTAGLPDIIDHLESGYLAEPFDTNDLANGIEWVLQQQGSYEDCEISKISEYARNSAVKKFSYENIARKYKALYKSVIEDSK